MPLVVGLALACGVLGAVGWYTSAGVLAVPTPGRIVRSDRVLPLPRAIVRTDECTRTLAPWRLPGFSPARLDGLLRGAGLDDTLRATVESQARYDASGCTVTVDLDTVARLPATARGALYQALGQSALNTLQAAPFRRAAGLPRWQDAPGLPAAARDLLDGLTWREGDDVLFADLPVVCNALATDDDRVAFIAVIKGRPAVEARVVVPHGADVDPIVRYWLPRGGPEARALGQRLAALAARPGHGEVDVADLLPPVARSRLDTFPAEGEQLDCFWTTLNFDADEGPSDRLRHGDGFEAVLAAEWQPVDLGAMRLGDAVVFRTPGRGVTHAAVYVAEALVFTKNGGSSRRPWVLSTLDDVRGVYPGATDVRAYRRRPGITPTR